MKSRLLLTAAMLSFVVSAADAAPRKKNVRGKAKAVAVQPKVFVEFGALAKLEGASWEEEATGTVATYRWLIPGEKMQVEFRLSTGATEESLIVKDAATRGLILTRKDSKGKESSSTATADRNGSVTETIGRGDAVGRMVYRLGTGSDTLVVETATLTGGVWQTGQANQFRRLSVRAAAELRSAAHQQMLQRWGALAGLVGKSWRRELKGQEHLQSFAWEVPGEVMVQRDTIAGKDPSKHGQVTIYRFDTATGKIATSHQAGQSKPQSGVATIEADRVIALKSEKSPSTITYVRLVSPGLYQVDSGKIGKNGFKSKDQLVYALETPQAVQARAAATAQAVKLADAKAAEKVTRKAKKGGGGLLGGLVGAAKSVVGGAAGGAVLEAVVGGAGHALGSGLVGMLTGAAGGGAGAAALAAQLGGKSEDALSAAILAQTLGGGGEGLAATATGAGGGLLGKLTGGLGTLARLTPMGMVGSLAVGALAKAAGGSTNDAAGLQLMFAAIKSEDPGALLTAIRMMETSGGGGSSAGSDDGRDSAVATASSSASANSKGTVKPGSYPTRPNTLLGKPACRGYSNSNYKAYYEANQAGPDTQLHTMCAAAFNYYSMYLNAIRQGYNQADANLTYSMFEKTAATATHYRTTGN